MLSKIFSKDFFRERSLLALSGLSILLMATNAFRIFTTVKQYDYKVAVGYTQYGADSFELGEWYLIYELALFGLLTTIASLFISARLVRVDRSLAYIATILQILVLILLFIVSGAIIGASSSK